MPPKSAGPTLRKTPTRVEKPWDHEGVWAETEAGVGKTLYDRARETLPLRSHERNDETLYVLAGTRRLEVGPAPGPLEAAELEAGNGYRFPPGTVHRLIGVANCDVLEASTPHLDDVVRLEDRYGRRRPTS